jgi:hypothetical protein
MARMALQAGQGSRPASWQALQGVRTHFYRFFRTFFEAKRSSALERAGFCGKVFDAGNILAIPGV